VVFVGHTVEEGEDVGVGREEDVDGDIEACASRWRRSDLGRNLRGVW